jgi:nucleoside diphosphate kinase
MEQSLSYVLVTPYTVAKSRTGGVLSRLLSRISLELVGAQMVAMDQEIAKEFASIIKHRKKVKVSRYPICSLTISNRTWALHLG